MPEQLRKALHMVDLNLAPDVLLALNREPLRFTEIKESIRTTQNLNVHDSTFSRALKRVKQHGLVCHCDDEYTLTAAGRDLVPILITLLDWASRYPESLEPTNQGR